MVSVKLLSMAARSATAEPVERKLPGSMTVGRLKQLLQKLFKLEPALQVLYYKAEPGAAPTMLDEDAETLTYFGVTSGCEVFMNEVDLKAKQREEEQRKREEEERLERQLKEREKLEQLRRQQVSLETASVQAAATGVI
jgi:hypothetical protein